MLPLPCAQDAKLPLSHSTDLTSHDETASILKFRSFLHAARKHAASTAAASAAFASESEDSATNSCASSTEDTESSDSDDEISDNEAQQVCTPSNTYILLQLPRLRVRTLHPVPLLFHHHLSCLSLLPKMPEGSSTLTSRATPLPLSQLAARARSRCRRSASPSISTTAATAAHIPPPSPAPQPHIDPEGFWKRREYEWSWTPESPSPTAVKFEIPSIVLTPAPSPAEEQDSDVLGYTQAWTPLQASVCPVTSVSLLTVPECFVLQSDIPMAQPECNACSESIQLRYRKACEDETGMAAEDLATLNVEDQRRRGVHGRMWPTYVGTCVCAEWKAYALACKTNEDDLEAQETSEEEDSPASSPGMPCTPLSTPMELEESGEDKPQGPRWMDFDEDDEELPSLDDWT